MSYGLTYTDSKIKALIDFHNAIFEKTGFDATRIDQEFVPNNVTARAREYLHNEEVAELNDVLIGTGDDISKAHLLKELCDVLYVVYGTVVTLGLIDVLDEAFRRVHENNMLKVTNGTILKETGKFTKAKDHPKVDLTDLTKETGVNQKLQENALSLETGPA